MIFGMWFATAIIVVVALLLSLHWFLVLLWDAAMNGTRDAVSWEDWKVNANERLQNGDHCTYQLARKDEVVVVFFGKGGIVRGNASRFVKRLW